jgi:hypothetical protein
MAGQALVARTTPDREPPMTDEMMILSSLRGKSANADPSSEMIGFAAG